MSRFTIENEHSAGQTLYLLRDHHTGADACIWPGHGNNCLAAHLPAPNGGLVTVLLAAGRPDQVRRQPSWWGVPLLFPWPGRIPGGVYEFNGQRYQLPELNASGHAGHGFAKDRPWQVARAEVTAERAGLACTFSAADHPETLGGYPFPYRLTATYELDGAGLCLHIAVRNEGTGAMPFGFGAHPYFRIPIDPAGRREDCTIAVPAARRWNLSRIATIGTPGTPGTPGTAGTAAGDHKLTRAGVTEPVSGEFDLRQPRSLGERQYDSAFTDLDVQDSWLECSVTDPRAGLSLVMRATAGFGTVVVYTPPGRPGICFEPWTCPPNAFNLAARGVEDTGLAVLAPGTHWEGAMRLLVRSAHASES